MTDQTNSEGQKTVVAFIAGLLVGGLLVWVFNDTPAQAPAHSDDQALETGEMAEAGDEDTDEMEDDTNAPEVETAAPAVEPVAELPVGDAAAAVSDAAAGTVVALDSATFPTDEGWVGVRSYVDGQFTNILGASRYSKEQGLVPEAVQLLTPTITGREYAIVFFSENGDRQFDPRTDIQLDTEVTTFVAN